MVKGDGIATTISPIRRACLRWLACTAIFLPVAASAAQETTDDPVGIALAGSVSARPERGVPASANPALAGSWLAAENPPITLDLSFAPACLGITGFRDGMAQAAWRHDARATWSAQAWLLAAGPYRRVAVSGAGAYAVLPQLTVGLRLALDAVTLERYSNGITFSVDAGLLARLTNRIRFGAAAANLTRAGLWGMPMPARLRVGLAFDLDRGTTLSVDVTHQERRGADASVGISSTPIPALILRAGAGTEPGRVAGGVGYTAGDIRVDVGAAYVPPLGVQQCIGVGITW